MDDFKDVAPSFETVPLWGKQVSVPGVSLEGAAMLLSRFPAFSALMDREAEAIELKDIFAFGTETVSAIFAAGFGHPGDEEVERKASSMNLTEQMTVLKKIAEVTMPNGIGPFVDEIAAFLGRIQKETNSLMKKLPKVSKADVVKLRTVAGKVNLRRAAR